MRVVYDTNIIISGLFWKGLPYKCLLLAKAKEVELFLCEEILSELSEKLIAKFHFTELEVKRITEEIKSFSKIVSIKGNLKVVKEDRDDDNVIECAYNSKADFIVSGDAHLLKIKRYKRIKILNAKDFLIEISKDLIL